jgi:hypothetical protein
MKNFHGRQIDRHSTERERCDSKAVWTNVEERKSQWSSENSKLIASMIMPED